MRFITTNRPRTKTENYSVVCEIHRVIYNSIQEASRITREREGRIRNKLNNNIPGYVILEKVRHGYERIVIDGKEYDSIVEVVRANVAPNRLAVVRRLKSKKYKNWNYLSPEKYINKEE